MDPTEDTGPSPPTTIVNGLGLWQSWTRNFASPILALFDLIDNAIDAGFNNDSDLANADSPIATDDSATFVRDAFKIKLNHAAQIHVKYDDTVSFFSDSTGNTDPDSSVNNNIHIESQNKVRDGIVMINNSTGPITPLEKIFEAYTSSKGKNSDYVGENGVGLKQGCASLSDLSFVITRNHDVLNIGIIAKDLQHSQGCFLPSFTLNINDSLYSVFGKNDDDDKTSEVGMKSIQKCITAFGLGNYDNGITRLTLHIKYLVYSELWKHENYVFYLIMDQIHHNVTDDDDNSQDDDDKCQDDIHPSSKNDLLSQLSEQLPKQYIHIPNTFSVFVNDKKIIFNYWQNKLIEMSVFDLKVHKALAWENDDDWKNQSNYESKELNRYNLRVYAGFDPSRVSNSRQSAGSTLSLYVYSRTSGRLIKYVRDARATLDLVSSGTVFCQGLTLILDDYLGNLPLSPTKQDIAFTEEARGEVHSRNLYSWLGGIANAYYFFHLSKFKNKLKAALTAEILDHYDNIIDASSAKQSDDDNEDNNTSSLTINKPLAECDFTTYQHAFTWKSYLGKIRNNVIGNQTHGQDTIYRLNGSKRQQARQETKRKAKEAVTKKINNVYANATTPDKRKRKTVQEVYSESEISSYSSSEDDDDNPDDEIKKKREPSPSPRKRTKASKLSSRQSTTSYNELERKYNELKSINKELELKNNVLVQKSKNKLKIMKVEWEKEKQKRIETGQILQKKEKEIRALKRQLRRFEQNRRKVSDVKEEPTENSGMKNEVVSIPTPTNHTLMNQDSIVVCKEEPM